MVLKITILQQKRVEPFTLTVDYFRVSDMKNEENSDYPLWTELAYHQCSHCPYTKQERKYCMPALDLVPVVEYFSRNFSYEKAKFIIQINKNSFEFNNITVEEICDLQTALRHVFLAIIFSSDCKIFTVIKNYILNYGFIPAGEHTPIRILSILLVEKFLQVYCKKQPEFKSGDIIEKIRELGKNVYTGLMGLFERVKHASIAEANINAMVSALEALNLFEFTFEDELKTLAQKLCEDE